MKRIVKMLRSLVNNLLFAIEISYQSSKRNFYAKIVCLLLITALPLVVAYVWKLVLNGISLGGDKKLLIVMVVSYLVLYVFVELLRKIDEYLNTCYEDDATFFLEKKMIDKTSRIDVSFFESAKIGDRIQRVRNNFYVVKNATWRCFDIVFGIVGLVSALIIVLSENIMIGIVAIVSLMPKIYIDKKHFQNQVRIEKEIMRDQRLADYYDDALFGNDVMFETKLNDAGNFFMSRHHEHWYRQESIQKKERVSFRLKSILGGCIAEISEVLVAIYAVLSVIRGKMDIGSLQYYISITVMLVSNMDSVQASISEFLTHNERMQDIRDFLALKPIVENSGKCIVGEKPRVAFWNVSFRYPGCERFVLKNCNFAIEPCEKVGLVGLNGAGKSTIIKLLLRFYDVTEGKILIDGKDIKDYDVYSLRDKFGVLFQDYVEYSLPMREIIALSDFSKVKDDTQLDEACRISGASTFIDEWEKRYDTVLGRYYEDEGKTLSGGQWQKTGLARAFFKKSKFMILDEPSAALDPLSEDRIFNLLYSQYKDSSALTITHRLCNVVNCDKILVLDEGAIVETGTHLELMEHNGKYAKLFKLQAEQYCD